ncbi:MAG: glycosyltransferase family 4 protein [Bacteroidota bacterium]
MNLLVLNYEYPPLGGGAGEITKNISENIAAEGHRVTVVTACYGELADDETINKVRIIRLKSKRKVLFRSDVFEMLSWIKKSKTFLKTFCNNEKFDVCFANFAIPGGDVACFLKRKFDIPYTIISHGHDIPWLFKKEMFFYHLLTYFRIKKICKDSSFNFVQTPEMKNNIDHFLSEKYAEKNIIIQNGIDRNAFFPDISKRMERLRILFSGRLVHQKDPFTFLKALNQLVKENISDFDVLISGDGLLRKNMELYVVENKLNYYVKFSGWMDRDILIAEYQKANLFVQTSKYEAMSMAVMEALASGAFVICTMAGSNNTIVRDGTNGYFFETGNYLMLSEKIKTAFQKLSSDKKWIAPSDTVNAWKTLADEYLKYFRKALTG